METGNQPNPQVTDPNTPPEQNTTPSNGEVTPPAGVEVTPPGEPGGEVTPPAGGEVTPPQDFDFANTNFGGENGGVINPDDFTDLVTELGLDINNEGIRGDINSLANNGFNKEQIGYLFNTYMRPAPKPTAEEVQARLATVLTNEQKRDYSPVGQMISEVVPQDKRHLVNEFMQNEELIGIAHAIYKKYVVGGGQSKTVNSGTNQGTPAPTTSLTYKEALDGYKKASQDMINSGNIDHAKLSQIKAELVGRCSDPEKLLTVLGK